MPTKKKLEPGDPEVIERVDRILSALNGNPPQEPESDGSPENGVSSHVQKQKYISNSLIACAITVHYGGISVTLEKRIYSEATSLQEQSAEYDKLELQLEKHHSEYRMNHLPKFKKPGG